MGRYRSVQSTLIESALKGITDNQTVTAYKKDCKLFAAFCKEQGVKRPDQLQGREKELLQAYEKELEAAGYSAATIHRRLAAPCKAKEEMQNKIDLHGLRREHAQRAYEYYADRLKNEPGYKYELRKELAARYREFHRPGDSNKRFLYDIMNEKPYELRGENRQKAIEQGKETEYNRLALMAVSVLHLSHWRLGVTATNYLI